MNDFSNMRLFCLLAEPSQEVTNDEMQRAYGELTQHIEAVSSSDNYTSIFRILNLTRIELAYLQTVFRYEQGEKCA